MCDYSLMCIPNRLARSGEELVTHRFETGAIGFRSTSEHGRLTIPQPKDIIERILWWLNQGYVQYTAVCLPPGARLAVLEVPPRLNAVFAGPFENHQVTFTQLSPGPGFRDAIRKPDGQEILLQNLQDGFRVRVLSVSAEEESTPEVLEGVLSM